MLQQVLIRKMKRLTANTKLPTISTSPRIYSHRSLSNLMVIAYQNYLMLALHIMFF